VSSEENTRTMSQIALESFGAYQKARQLFDLVVADMEILKTNPLWSKKCRVGSVEGKGSFTPGTPLIRFSLDTRHPTLVGNIEEGYGRLSRVEYVRFLDFARGSARETRGRYERMKHWLDEGVIKQRIALLDEIIGILTASIGTMRKK
jgi:hypothetical protein